jgi:two-component system chemotaxis response regulator CheB
MPVRVLVVDDSAFMRSMVGRMLLEAGFEVAGYAGDGAEALAQLETLQPDVVTMDVEMPGMNGLEAVDAIMRRGPLPIVMLSAYTQTGAAITVDALARGAVDFITKPADGADLSVIRTELVEKLKRAAALDRAQLRGVALPAGAGTPFGPAAASRDQPADAGPASTAVPPLRRRSRQVVAIGTSTGGPAALSELLPSLPGDLPAGILIVQHMPAGFTRALADRLDSLTSLTVREAVAGETVQDGLALVAPGDFHMAVSSGGCIVLSKDPPVHSVRPAADVLLASAAAVYGPACVAVILTGMGHDGAEGAAEVRRAGGQVIVQDARSSVIFGMASSVLDAGGADAVVPLSGMAGAIVEACGRPVR